MKLCGEQRRTIMTCHLCENSAIGLCRQCYKFYCREHGDSFCKECQQMGWTREKSITSHSYSGLTSEQGSRAELTSSSSSETLDKETVADQEKARPISAWTAVHNAASGQTANLVGTNYYKLEEITDPAHFISLLPVFGISRVHDVLILLRGIEIYRETFGFELMMRFGPKAENDAASRHIHLSQHEFSVTDDVDTQYTLYSRGGCGGNQEWSQRYLIMPALNPKAQTLTITLPRLPFIEHHPGRQGMQPKPTYLNGPWIITSAIPPREESIS
jgi:hypothetical protein